MAIANYVATATPVAGGNSVTGYVVYDGTKAYIVPQTATMNLASDTGVMTITPATPTDIVEVTPASVSITGNIQSAKTVSNLAANAGTITPDEGYDGIASITISSVKLQSLTTDAEVYSDESGDDTKTVQKTDSTAWGLSSVTVNNIRSQAKTVTSTKEAQTVNPDSGYDVLSSVSVQPYTPVLQMNVEVDPTEEEQTIEPADGYDGIGQVVIGAIPTETKTVTATKSQQVVNATSGKYLKSVTVNGYTVKLQNKSVDPSESQQEITPDSTYDGLGNVTVGAIVTETKTVKSNTSGNQTVNATPGKYIKTVTVQRFNVQTKTVSPAESQTSVDPDDSYDALSSVTVNAIPIYSPSAVTPNDETQTVENSGQYIKSVTVNPVPTETKTVKSNLTGNQTVNPTTGKYIKSITVQPLTGQTKTVEASETIQSVSPDSGYDVLTRVTVNPIEVETKEAVTPTKTSQVINATSGKYFKTITVAGYTPNLQNKTVNPADSDAVVSADTSYDGLGQVTVKGVPLYSPETVVPNDSVQTVSAPSNQWMKTVKVEKVPTEAVPEITPTKETQVINPSAGKYIKTVTVKPYTPVLQNKTVDPEEAEVEVSADSNFDGLAQVTINPIQTETKTVQATKSEQTVTPTTGKYLKSVTVEGYELNLHSVEVDELTVGQKIFTEAGYDGISEVTVNGVKLEEKSFTPDITGSTIQKSDSTAWGLSRVTVNPVPVENKTVQATKEDQTVTAESDSFMTEVRVEGYVPLLDMSLEITPTEKEQSVTVPTGYDGFGQVVVKKTPLDEAITLDPSETEQVKTPTGLGFKGVTVTPIQIDSTNNSAVPTGEEQVKTPIEGTYFKEFTVAQTPLDEAITVQSGTETVEHTPETLGYKGVTVTGDANLIPGNIRKSISILGVKGTYLAPEAGTNENGFVVDEWVELDLPDIITKSEAFKATPFLNNHYLGKTFDGGDYMSVAIFTRYGRIASTVYLNDILGKFYIERTKVENPFPLKDGKIVLFEDVSSLEIDWASVEVVFGNNHTISVDEPIEIQGEISFDSVVFKKENLVTETPFLGTPAYFSHCAFEGFTSIQLGNQNASFINCTFTTEGEEEKYQLDCVESTVIVERSTFSGLNGVRIEGGNTILRANTFATSNTAILVAKTPREALLEGNIFNNPQGQLTIEDSIDVSNIFLIGDIEITGENYKIEGNSIVPVEKETSDVEKKLIDFFNELDQGAITDYMISNKDAVMQAFGVTEESSIEDLGTLLYDKLQEGGTVTANMNDGGQLNIRGHFYEPSDDFPYWEMEIEYKVPGGGTNKCFPAGSQMSVKGGTVTIHVTRGELTSWGDWNMVLLIYGYAVDISGVTVVDGEGTYEINITGLIRPDDYDNPCIIDPDSSTWEIHVRQFFLPDADAEGTLAVDDTPVQWSEIRPQIK